MKWHYDVCGAEPIIRDIAYYGDGSTDLVKGAVIGVAAQTTQNYKFAAFQVPVATLANVIGVTNEKYDASEHLTGANDPLGPLGSGTTGATAYATGVTNYLKTIINPYAIYLAEYSQLTADMSTNDAASTTGKLVTETFEQDVEGDWIYFSSLAETLTTGGAGNLFQIGDTNSTTDVDAVTDYDDHLEGILTTDRFIRIRAPYSQSVAAGCMDLAANYADLKGLADAGTGAILCIESYITDKATPLAPLRAERHSGKNYDSATAKMYSDVLLTDHMMIAPTIVNSA